MSMGDGLLAEAFEAMGFPIPEVKRVAARLLLVSMVLFPVTFRHALMAYANKEVPGDPRQAATAAAPPSAPAASEVTAVHRKSLRFVVPDSPPKITPEVARALLGILFAGEQWYEESQVPLAVDLGVRASTV